MVDKSTLRRVYLEKRLTLSQDELFRRNDQLVATLLSHIDFTAFKYIHLFVPILKKKEVNTWKVMEAVRNTNQSAKFVTSRMLKDGELEHFEIDVTTRFEENKWGVPQPVGACRADIGKIDLVLIPLIVYDKQGHRIGYGKGYYDRFLKKIAQAYKLGVSLGPPLDVISDNNAYDVRMDACVSPFMFYKFQMS